MSRFLCLGLISPHTWDSDQLRFGSGESIWRWLRQGLKFQPCNFECWHFRWVDISSSHLLSLIVRDVVVPPCQRLASVKVKRTWNKRLLMARYRYKWNRRPVIALNFYTVKLRDTHYPLLVIKRLTGSWTEGGRGLWMIKDKREMKTMRLFH